MERNSGRRGSEERSDLERSATRQDLDPIPAPRGLDEELDPTGLLLLELVLEDESALAAQVAELLLYDEVVLLRSSSQLGLVTHERVRQPRRRPVECGRTRGDSLAWAHGGANHARREPRCMRALA